MSEFPRNKTRIHNTPRSTRFNLLFTGNDHNSEMNSLSDLRLRDGSLNERGLTHMLLRQVQPNFIWDSNNDFVEWDHNIAEDVLLNKFRNPALYTSKVIMRKRDVS